MTIEIQQAAVLIAFALALLFVNIKAGSQALKVISYWAMIATFAAAGWIITEWVFL